MQIKKYFIIELLYPYAVTPNLFNMIPIDLIYYKLVFILLYLLSVVGSGYLDFGLQLMTIGFRVRSHRF